MTGRSGGLEGEQIKDRPLDGRLENRLPEAHQQRARELADEAGPLTSEQMVLLKGVFSHMSRGGG